MRGGRERRKWTSCHLPELHHPKMYSEAAVSRNHHKIHSSQATAHRSAPYILLHIVFNTNNCVSLLDHLTPWYPAYAEHPELPVRAYLWIPWKVLLAMSTIPPVGRATTPTSPFPIPLKKPAAPSFLAPLKEREQKKK